MNTVFFRCCVLTMTYLMSWSTYAQEDDYFVLEDTLDPVEMTLEDARKFFQEFLDIRSLNHNVAVKKMSEDPKLVSYLDGFKERNGIDAITFSYIEGNKFWEEVFNSDDKREWNAANGDLVKGRIVFERVGDESGEGYDVYLEVKAGSQKVYELFSLFEWEFQEIVEEYETQFATNQKVYNNPGEAQQSVINALLGALTEIEGFGKEELVGDSVIKEPIYTLPLQVSLADSYFLKNPEKTRFSDGDTITLDTEMDGITLFLSDSENTAIEIKDGFIPNVNGDFWFPGYVLDVKDLIPGDLRTISFQVPDIDTLDLSIQVLKRVDEKEKVKGISSELLKEINQNALAGITAGESWNPDSYACNNAVRAYLYYQKSDPVLFPETMPEKPDDFRYGSGLSGPNDQTVLKGQITWDGTADMMYEDLSKKTSFIRTVFSPVERKVGEKWKAYFERLQVAANEGNFVVGLVHSSNRQASRGHIVALLPISTCSGNQQKANGVGEFEENNIRRPCCIEAGANEKEMVWFKQKSDEIDKYKWFQYSK